MIFSGIFEDVGIEGLLVFEHSEDEVQELVHDGTEDDDFGFSLFAEPFCESLADGVVEHGCHGGEKEHFAHVGVAGLGHGGSFLAAGAGFKDRGRDPGMGCKLSCV